jgi:hypothetical protein
MERRVHAKAAESNAIALGATAVPPRLRAFRGILPCILLISCGFPTGAPKKRATRTSSSTFRRHGISLEPIRSTRRFGHCAADVGECREKAQGGDEPSAEQLLPLQNSEDVRSPTDLKRREGVRQNAYRCVAVAARNRENQLRPPSPLCPVITRRCREKFASQR